MSPTAMAFTPANMGIIITIPVMNRDRFKRPLRVIIFRFSHRTTFIQRAIRKRKRRKEDRLSIMVRTPSMIMVRLRFFMFSTSTNNRARPLRTRRIVRDTLVRGNRINHEHVGNAVNCGNELFRLWIRSRTRNLRNNINAIRRATRRLFNRNRQAFNTRILIRNMGSIYPFPSIIIPTF